jgi:hypothetical protein
MSIKPANEAAVMAGCLQLLRLAGVFHWRANCGAAHLDGGRRRRFVRFGLRGCSDILGILPGGRFLAVEVKRPGGKVTEVQRWFLDQITAAGGVALVVSDVRQLEELLRKEKIL